MVVFSILILWPKSCFWCISSCPQMYHRSSVMCPVDLRHVSQCSGWLSHSASSIYDPVTLTARILTCIVLPSTWLVLLLILTLRIIPSPSSCHFAEHYRDAKTLAVKSPWGHHYRHAHCNAVAGKDFSPFISVNILAVESSLPSQRLLEATEIWQGQPAINQDSGWRLLG